MGYAFEAIKNSKDDELVVSLARPIKRGAIEITTSTSEFKFKNGKSRPVTNRVTELGLLHILWERAKLNEYCPKRNIETPWPKVRQACYGIRPSGINGLANGLSDLLLLPVHAETENQAARNFAKLKEAQKNGRFVLFVAQLSPNEVASLLNAESSSFSLKDFFGVNLTLYANCAEPLLRNIKRSFIDELSYSQTDGDDLIALGIAQPSDSKNYAKINSMVFMPIIAGHLPYDSRFEKRFALELVRQARKFKKPLKYEASRDMHVHPDFMLLDTLKPIVIEIYGMATSEYLARKEEKRSIYSSEDYPFTCWEWDAALCNDLTQWLGRNPLPSHC